MPSRSSPTTRAGEGPASSPPAGAVGARLPAARSWRWPRSPLPRRRREQRKQRPRRLAAHLEQHTHHLLLRPWISENLCKNRIPPGEVVPRPLTPLLPWPPQGGYLLPPVQQRPAVVSWENCPLQWSVWLVGTSLRTSHSRERPNTRPGRTDIAVFGGLIQPISLPRCQPMPQL